MVWVKRRVGLTAVLAVLAGMPAGHAAVIHFGPGQPYTTVESPSNLVQNGDFTADPLVDPNTPGHQNPHITDWSVTGAYASDVALTLNNNSGPPSGRGLRLSGYRGLTDVTQILATVPGATYQLSFFLATTGSTGTSTLVTHLQVFEAGTSLELLNNVPTNVTSGPNPTAFFSEYVDDFVATSTSTPLTFEYQDPHSDLYLANVAVLPVPEPSTVILMAGVIGAAATSRRRRPASSSL